MLIIPAIDLKDGKVVRLLKGDFNTVQQVNGLTSQQTKLLEAVLKIL